jgi:hypothetical protein
MMLKFDDDASVQAASGLAHMAALSLQAATAWAGVPGGRRRRHPSSDPPRGQADHQWADGRQSTRPIQVQMGLGEVSCGVR